MKDLDCDVLIVGAGLTGLITAKALSDFKINIILIDGHNFNSAKSNFHDIRTTAITEGSKIFLEKVGIWNKISHFAEPIHNINVVDREQDNKIDFNTINKNLAYVLKNNIIKNKTLELIRLKKNVKLIQNKPLNKINTNQDFIISESSNLRITSKLLIAADGKKSFVRSHINKPIFKKEYNHKALVVNFDHFKNHKGTAHEIFYSSGPLAILPIKSTNKKNYSSTLIWSHNPKYIDSLHAINKNLLKLILNEKINYQVGKILNIVDVQTFKLSAHINADFYDNRIIFVGDSAHSIHPIAGQGWNLGLRDVKNCLETVKESLILGQDIGSINYCKKYNDKTFYDAHNFYQITDKLNSIFTNETLMLKKIRNIGFKEINKKTKIKKLITNFAMGL